MPAVSPGTTGLVAWWALDEESGNRADSHTGGYTLTDNNTVEYEAGVKSNAAKFTVANSEYLSLANGLVSAFPFSLACWVKVNTLVAAGNYVAFGKSTDAGPIIMIRDNSSGGELQVYIRPGSGGDVSLVSADEIDDGNWHHAVLVSAAGNDHKLYVDAAAVVTSASSILIPPVDQFAIGALWRVAVSNYVTSAVDNVSVWTAALTADNVAWLYNSGSGRTYADLTAVAAAGLPVIAWEHARAFGA